MIVVYNFSNNPTCITVYIEMQDIPLAYMSYIEILQQISQ